MHPDPILRFPHRRHRLAGMPLPFQVYGLEPGCSRADAATAFVNAQESMFRSTIAIVPLLHIVTALDRMRERVRGAINIVPRSGEISLGLSPGEESISPCG
jgi:hypothetical protein